MLSLPGLDRPFSRCRMTERHAWCPLKGEPRCRVIHHCPRVTRQCPVTVSLACLESNRCLSHRLGWRGPMPDVLVGRKGRPCRTLQSKDPYSESSTLKLVCC